MLSQKDELKIIKKLIKSSSKLKYTKHKKYYKILVEAENEIVINIVDDIVIDDVRQIIIDFDSNDDINCLKININSGKYHKKDKIIGTKFVGDDYEIELHPSIRFQTNNKIRKLIVNQNILTENIYSYYGNQDGFSASNIIVNFKPNKYTKFEFNGNFNMHSGKHECDYDGDTYDLLIMLK